MKQLIWGMLLITMAVFADVRVPSPWTPADWNAVENPAVKWTGLRLGLLWTEPMEGVDYETLGFAAEWGNERFRLRTAFASSFMDSLYRSENFALEASIHLWRLTLGSGATADVQMVPGDATWWRGVAKSGVSVELPARLHLGAWMSLPSDFEENAGYAELLWKPGNEFRSGTVLRYRRRDGVCILFLQHLRLGALEMQGSFAYPGPRIGLGIVCRIQMWGASFGYHHDGNYMNSRLAGIFVMKN